ncbi:hypothetical protein V3481_008886 [Fusarium oxysporum f. sp. vasinfectum]
MLELQKSKEKMFRLVEEHPSCSRCIRRGLACSYGLRLQWEDETRCAGIAFGRAAPHNRTPETTYYLLPVQRGRLRWLHTTADDVRRFPYGGASTRADERPGPAMLELSLPPSLSSLPSLEHNDGTLLQYYTQEWSAHRMLSKKLENPFQRLILPRAFQFSPLLHMIMSLAAHDLFNRTHADQEHQRQEFYSSMLQHKLQSLRDMRQLLCSSKGLDDTYDSISQCEKDGLLMAVMLHSLMEIATNSTREWVVHTLGGLSMVKRYGHEPFSPEVYRFVTDHFSLFEAFLATTGTELEIEDLNGWLVPQRKSMFPILRSMHGRSRINPYTGLSSELIQNITSITSTIQRHSRAGSDRKSATIMRTELQAVEDRLSELQQWSEDSDMESLIYINAAAFEAAAWVYLRVAQYGCEAEEIQKSLMPKLFEAIRRVHDRRDALVGSVPYPLWALFIAACLAPEHERIQVLDWFEELKGCRSLSNVSSTMEATMMVWKQHDLKLINGHVKGGRESGVPWHEAVRCLGWMLSLM